MFARVLLILTSAYVFIGCSTKQTEITTTADVTRPVFHFTPPKNWTNDPNGLVYYDGEYHLFYQHNPYGMKWGHMSWGHAVTRDFLKWEHLPIAIREYQDRTTGDSTMIFSGTVVVDPNTSGLCSGKECMVAIYTSHLHAKGEGLRQHQSIAWSNDKGRTWTVYDKNPVLDIQRKDFRDPKVFWHEPSKKWVMILVIPDQYKTQLYESKNLTAWKLMSEFGGVGDTLKIWECPDLFELPVEGNPGETKWVLSLSGSHPAGPKFVGMQYFVGDFDGTNFTPDKEQPVPMYVEYGKDFYAGIIFNNMPREQNRTVMLGWFNNWNYGNEIPATDYRSAMSLPRELRLKKSDKGYLLTQTPVHEVESLRKEEITDFNSVSGKTLELQIDLVADGDAGVKVFKSGNEETIIGYDSKTGELFIDRTKSGKTDFSPDFASVERTAITPKDGKIRLQIILDLPIIEVFANDGEVVMSEYAFANGNELKVETYGKVEGKRAFRLKL